MIIFLYGRDSHRSRQKLNEIIDSYIASGSDISAGGRYKKTRKIGLNLKHFDCKEKDFQEFREEVRSASIFREKKLFILRNVFSNPGFKINFLEQGKSFLKSDDIILVYEENDIPGRDKLADFLEKYAKSQEFEPLEGQKLKTWIKKELEVLAADIEERALDRLIEFVGNNLWQMTNEVKKLTAYIKNNSQTKKKIEVKDVELLVKPKIETAIFKTIDSLASKNKKQALRLLHEHLEKGDNPLYLLSMVNFQFRNLLIVKNLIEKKLPYYSILKRTKLHPFVAKKSYWQAQKFTIQELKKIYQKLFEADFNIKAGRVKPEAALDILIAEI
jgi:DNA polymerase-3 subunit delta